MALCGTIKHHNKNEKPCVLGFWHFLTSERIAGLSASLSAKPADYFSGFLFYNKFPISISVSFLVYLQGDDTIYMIYSESM